MANLESLLIRHEGLRLKPYRCSAGKLTIGVGRNLDANGITREEAMQMLRADIAKASQELVAVIGPEAAANLNDARRAVLISMVFNLGRAGFANFAATIAAVKAQDWTKAADQMSKSLWAKQVGNRAKELCSMMRTGDWV
jgi:lysozyme